MQRAVLSPLSACSTGCLTSVCFMELEVSATCPCRGRQRAAGPAGRAQGGLGTGDENGSCRLQKAQINPEAKHSAAPVLETSLA